MGHPPPRTTLGRLSSSVSLRKPRQLPLSSGRDCVAAAAGRGRARRREGRASHRADCPGGRVRGLSGVAPAPAPAPALPRAAAQPGSQPATHPPCIASPDSPIPPADNQQAGWWAPAAAETKKMTHFEGRKGWQPAAARAAGRPPAASPPTHPPLTAFRHGQAAPGNRSRQRSARLAPRGSRARSAAGWAAAPRPARCPAVRAGRAGGAAAAGGVRGSAWRRRWLRWLAQPARHQPSQPTFSLGGTSPASPPW